MLESVNITCPYCWATFETTVDCSGGSQEYVEDCQICCNPILLRLDVDLDGNLLAVETLRGDD